MAKKKKSKRNKLSKVKLGKMKKALNSLDFDEELTIDEFDCLEDILAIRREVIERNIKMSTKNAEAAAKWKADLEMLAIITSKLIV